MRDDGSCPPRRPRDAAATRAAILAAARVRFSQESYERVGVRDIAAAACIDPALVIRYFGSKEALFAEAFRIKAGFDKLLAGDRGVAGERLVRHVLSKQEVKDGFNPMLAILHSAANEQAGAMLRRVLNEQFVRPLAAWLGGDQAELRAGLIMACLLGLMVGRDVLRAEALVAADTESLVALLAPVVQAYVDGVPTQPAGAGAAHRAGFR